jgi:hypothetical protein
LATSGGTANPRSEKNGKIKPDWVVVKGREEHHPEGNFYLHRYEGDREIWKRTGPSAQEAVNAADYESTYLTARAKGIPVQQIDTPVLSIKAAAHGWLEDVKLSNRPETYELYEHTLRQFQEWNLNGGPHRIKDISSREETVICNSTLFSFSRILKANAYHNIIDLVSRPVAPFGSGGMGVVT